MCACGVIHVVCACGSVCAQVLEGASGVIRSSVAVFVFEATRLHRALIDKYDALGFSCFSTSRAGLFKVHRDRDRTRDTVKSRLLAFVLLPLMLSLLCLFVCLSFYSFLIDISYNLICYCCDVVDDSVLFTS